MRGMASYSIISAQQVSVTNNQNFRHMFPLGPFAPNILDSE